MNAVQVHMPHALNTPIEVLETAYPWRVRAYALRSESGGAGAGRPAAGSG